jgi:hypothetical protein
MMGLLELKAFAASLPVSSKAEWDGQMRGFLYDSLSESVRPSSIEPHGTETDQSHCESALAAVLQG